MNRPARRFTQHGFEIHGGVLDPDTIERVRSEIRLDHNILHRTGIRNLEKKFQCIADIACHESVLAIARAALGGQPRLVRALFFDKTPIRNWQVGWHQDRMVTLNQRIASDGWGPWTCKDGVHHAQPPREVLEHMATIRLHADPADGESGCLAVIPGSHVLGVLSASEIERVVARLPIEQCPVQAGDALVMRPLILHSSARSRKPAHRRVVHLEYCSYELPPGVDWA